MQSIHSLAKFFSGPPILSREYSQAFSDQSSSDQWVSDQDTPEKPTAGRHRFPVELLINYLHINRESVFSLEQFESLTDAVLSKSHDAELLKCVRSHYWNGNKFFVTEERPFDVEQMIKDLSNLYLKQTSSQHSVSFHNLFHIGNSTGLEQLLSFCPNIVLEHLKNFDIETSTNNVKRIEFTGCCMLVDISGFTKFSSQMCAQGVAGLDDLRKITDDFLGFYVHTIYEFGGDVMAFAGDSLLCIFNDERVSPKAVLDCAAQLRTVKTRNLSTHIGIAHGPMTVSLLGGEHDQFVSVLSGECIAEIGPCLNMAHAQDVVVTHKFLTHFQTLSSSFEQDIHQFKVSEESSEQFFLQEPVVSVKRKGMRSLESHYKAANANDDLHPKNRLSKTFTSIAPGFLDSVAKFVARPVLNATYSESLDFIGEFRQVTTLFVSLDNIYTDFQYDIDILQKFMLLAQKALFDSGGFLRQFLVDDKGCVLICMWGMPSFTYANNCSRALAFAVRIQVEALREVGIKTSIGITTGNVFCGTVGSIERRDYVGIASEVNLAARLMCNAKGKILMDETTFKHLPIENRRELIASMPLDLKGMDQPFVPYEFIGQTIPKISALDDTGRSNKNSGNGSKNGVKLRRKVTTKLAKILDECLNSSPTSVVSSSAAGSTLVSTSASASVQNEAKQNNNNNNNNNNKSEQKATVVAVLGQPGTGKSLAADYCRQAAHRRGIQVFRIQAYSTLEDIPYGMVRELIVELLQIDRRHSQRMLNRLCTLVEEAFPCSNGQEDVELEETRSEASSILQTVFNLSDNRRFSNSSSMNAFSRQEQPEKETKEEFQRESSSPREDNHNQQSRPFHRTRSRIIRNDTKKLIDEVSLYKIVAFLIKRIPTVLIIENAHNCDELSWQFLYAMATGHELNLVMVLTMKASSGVRNKNYHDDEEEEEEEEEDDNMMGLQLRSSEYVISNTMFEQQPPQSSNSSNGSPAKSSFFSNSSAAVNMSHVNSSSSFLFTSRPSFLSSTDQRQLSSDSVKSSSNNSTACSNILALENTEIIELGALSRDEVRELLTKALRESIVITDELVDFVMSTSSGNAFWCNSIANYIKEVGITKLTKAIQNISNNYGKSAENCSNNNGNNGLIRRQSSLQVVILLRLEKLPVEQILVLKYASVIGHEFTQALLKCILPAISPRFQLDLASMLETLCEEGFFTSIQQESPEIVYSFQNSFILNAVHDLIPPTMIAAIHEEIAWFYEKEFADNLRPYYAKLALHYRESKNHNSEAFKYQLKAADQAISQGAFKDGLKFAEISLSLAETNAELHLLSEVVSGAILDMNSVVRQSHKTSFSRNLRMRIKEMADRLPAYQALQSEIWEKIREQEDKLDTTDDDDNNKDRPSPNTVSRRRAPLTWQLSVTAKRHAEQIREQSLLEAEAVDTGLCCTIS